MAGLFGIFNDNVNKKEITKSDAEKRSFFKFWELFFLKFTKMLAGNLLYIIFSVPVLALIFIISGCFSSEIFSYILPYITSFYGTINDSTLNNPEFMQLFVYFDIIVRAFVSTLFVLFIGCGPIACGFNYLIRNYVKDKHAWVFSDFFEKTFKNFKQGIVILIIDIVVFFLLCNALTFYSEQGGMLSIVKYFILCVGVIYILMHIYIYPLVLTFKLPIKHILKNSLILSLANLPRSIFIFVIDIILFVFIPCLMFFKGYIYACIIGYFALFILILPAFNMFFVNYIISPVVDELIVKAKKE